MFFQFGHVKQKRKRFFSNYTTTIFVLKTCQNYNSLFPFHNVVIFVFRETEKIISLENPGSSQDFREIGPKKQPWSHFSPNVLFTSVSTCAR